jgi:polysaccharide export outer membrane protein
MASGRLQVLTTVSLLLMIGLPFTAASQEAKDAIKSSYRIGPGDVLHVHVWKEEQASVPEVAVRSDGKISLPLVGEVEARDLTTTELEKVLQEKLAKFIRSPAVTVVIKDARSEKVFVIGGVRKQGSIQLNAPMTVLQVLAESGGLTDYARKKKIYILRISDQKQIRLPFDYDAVIRNEHREQNIFVVPGDTIVVPE